LTGSNCVHRPSDDIDDVTLGSDSDYVTDSILSADSNSSTSTSTSTTTSGDSSNSASDDDSLDDNNFPPHAEPVHAPLPPPLLVQAPPPPPLFADNALGNQGVLAANQGVQNPGVGNNEFAADADDASVDIPGNENENGENGNENENDEMSGNDESTESQTESEEFRIAENQGCARAAQLNAARPRRTVRANRYDDFNYTFFDHMHNGIGQNTSDREFIHAYVTAQMSAKKGLKVFKEQGASALMKELHQIVVMNVMSGCKSHELTREEKQPTCFKISDVFKGKTVWTY
jgi:hypothetical protein